MEKRKRIIISLIVAWCLVVLAVVLFFVLTLGKVAVEVKYAPFAAVVKLDDTVIMNNNQNYITPGQYHLTVEYENFETYEAEVTITNDTQYMFGKLLPANETGEKYMQEHNTDFLEVEGIAGKIAADEGARQREQYPIINELPIKDPYYSIGYNFDDNGVLNVTVEASVSYRQLAADEVIDLMGNDGFGRYDVVFYDLDNPFAGKFVENEETNPTQYLKNGFKDVGVDFEVGNGTVQDEYYYTYLRYYVRDYVGVVFRVVLKWDEAGWKLMSEPYPLLTTHNTPDVPLGVINEVNRL